MSLSCRLADLLRMLWCGVKCMDWRVECRVEWDNIGWEVMVSFIIISSVQAQIVHLDYDCV